MFQSNEQQSAYRYGIVYVGMRKQEKARVECLLSLLPRVKQVVPKAFDCTPVLFRGLARMTSN
jgi:hypothetical protein